jgi:hypothetical protein
MPKSIGQPGVRRGEQNPTATHCGSIVLLAAARMPICHVSHTRLKLNRHAAGAEEETFCLLAHEHVSAEDVANLWLPNTFVCLRRTRAGLTI